MSYDINFLASYDAESLIAELKRISSVTGRPTVTTADIDSVGRVSYTTLLKQFGSIRKANEAAGLVPRAIRYWSDEELLGLVIELWNKTMLEEHRRPTMGDVRKYRFPVNAGTIAGRFGTWNKALLAANELVNRRWVARPRKARGERTTISKGTRFAIFKRDEYTCRICRQPGGVLEVDHIIPLARGGSGGPGNLQTLCAACNRGKSDSLQ